MLLWSVGDLLWTLWLDKLEIAALPQLRRRGLLRELRRPLLRDLRPRRRADSSWHEWIDGLIAALTTAALGVALVFPAVLAATSGSATTVAVTLAYPLLDVLLLGFVIVAIAVNRWRADPTWLLLAAGLATTAIADAIYNYQSSIGTYVAGSTLDSMWPVAVLFVAAAAWRPGAAGTSFRPNGRRSARIPCCSPSARSRCSATPGSHDVSPLAVGLAAAGLGLGIFRAAMVMSENRRLLTLATQESLTDGLTGLANRRALVRDLDAYFAPPGGLRPRTLALFDLDGFKTYNDIFGHAAGDELLAGLGGTARPPCAAAAAPIRLGGDEFCVLIAGERVAGAARRGAARR